MTESKKLSQYDDDSQRAVSAALESASCGEIFRLEFGDSCAVLRDACDAMYGEGIGAQEYVSRIGAGNMASYARTIKRAEED